MSVVLMGCRCEAGVGAGERVGVRYGMHATGRVLLEDCIGDDTRFHEVAG